MDSTGDAEAVQLTLVLSVIVCCCSSIMLKTTSLLLLVAGEQPVRWFVSNAFDDEMFLIHMRLGSRQCTKPQR